MSRQFHGLKAWLLQRITAIFSLLFLLYFVLALVIAPPADYLAWRNWIATPWLSIALSLFFVIVAIHAWVGMRDIVMDYIKPVAIKLLLLTLLGLALISSVFWALQAIILLQLGVNA